MSDKYKLTREERETVITFNDDETNAIVYTAQAKHVRKLDKFCRENPELFKCIRHDEYGGAEYIFPQKYIAFRMPRNSTMTEEQRRKVGERLKNSRNEDSE
jgi:hypothetical protein